jgi:hypothetical protein
MNTPGLSAARQLSRPAGRSSEGIAVCDITAVEQSKPIDFATGQVYVFSYLPALRKQKDKYDIMYT